MATPGHVHDHDSGEGLIAVDDARERVLGQIKPLQPLELPLTEAYGCVLAKSLVAERDIPDFASSAMDGFAVRSSEVADASPTSPVELRVVGRAMIGERPEGTVGGGEAFAIATGAPVPAGADTIVPVENTEVTDGFVRILSGSAAGKHVRPSGEDVRAGETLVQAGRRLQAPELGLLATAGFSHPAVHPRPRVVILSTGDELIPPSQAAEYGQVHDSNAYTLFAALREAGAVPRIAGISKDDVDAFKELVLSNLTQADAFISSGGVSVGERDVVKSAFFRRGEVDFFKVAMQPGMPQGAGAVNGTPIITLPGNPVSALVSFEVFIRAPLRTAMGLPKADRPRRTAVLAEDLTSPRGKRQFRRGVLDRDEGSVTSYGPPASHHLRWLASANCLLEIDEDVAEIAAGSPVRVWDLA
jgi:molybdopterin molybdotransferase